MRKGVLLYLGFLTFAGCTSYAMYDNITGGQWKRELASQGRKVENAMGEIGLHGWHDLTSIERIQEEKELEARLKNGWRNNRTNEVTELIIPERLVVLVESDQSSPQVKFVLDLVKFIAYGVSSGEDGRRNDCKSRDEEFAPITVSPV